ncbi:MAG: SGNH/GDSL hydrolase family protein [Verrucomicrobia bacterium]|nr:SGNH/GDSL hydrolase family protein [Verrucomicrobiota bacterium]
MHQLAALALAPLLVWQGAGVRRRTPKLPEPPGERSGRAGAGLPLRLLVLGDSAAAGVGAGTQAEALLGQLTQRLAERHEVQFQLLARTGARSREAAGWVEADAALAPDLAVLSLGVNDVTGGVSQAAFLRTYCGIVRTLLARGARRIVVSSLPPVHRFPALPQPLRWVLGRRALAFGNALERFAASEPRCVFVRISELRDPTLMATDGFHPGPSAYATWAEEIVRALGE